MHRATPPDLSPAGILSVSAHEDDHASLRSILSGARWRVVETCAPQDAKRVFLARPMPLIVWTTGASVRDWRPLVAEILRLPDPPSIIMASYPFRENLWPEAIELGCYDVLPLPYSSREVPRVIQMAGEFRDRKCELQAAVPLPARRERAAPQALSAGAA